MDFDGYGYLSSDDDTGVCISHHYSSDESDTDDGGDLDTMLMDAVGTGCHTEAAATADPFEEEMTGELDRAMVRLKALDGPGVPACITDAADTAPASGASSSACNSDGAQTSKQYDSIYFDSDEDDEDEGVQQHRSTLSDADLLYDPALDDLDQLWMDKHRSVAAATARARRGKRLSGKSKPGNSRQQPAAGSALPDSDAVLNCPGCLTMLCADCQRHASYSNQYRAMFVFSCKVDYTQLLSFPTKLTKKEIWKNKKKQRQNKRKQSQQLQDSSEENSTDYCNRQFDELVPVLDTSASGSVVELGTAPTEENIKRETDSNLLVDNCKKECKVPSNEIGLNISKEEGRSCEMTDSCEITKDFDKHSETDEASAVKQEHPPAVHILKCNDSHKRNVDSLQEKTPPMVKKVRFLETDKDSGENVRSSGISVHSSSSPDAFACTGDTKPALLQPSTGEAFHPVACQHCNTKVAVFDKDEVYHFFNVITSY